MGYFGGPHIDMKDSVGSFSVMASLCDLPKGKGWEPGRFHLLAVGVYFVLDEFALIYFTGRLRHGGTSPTAPRRYKMKGWEYRLVVIGYPSEKIQMADSRQPLAAMPYQQTPLYITPEMIGVNRVLPVSGHVNFAMDGQAVMRPRSHFTWFSRSLLQLSNTLLGQLRLADRLDDSADEGSSSEEEDPDDTITRVSVDPEKFLQAFTLHRRGRRYHPDNWALAPPADVRHPATEDQIRIQERVRNTLYAHQGQAIHNARSVFTGEPDPTELSAEARKSE